MYRKSSCFYHCNAGLFFESIARAIVRCRKLAMQIYARGCSVAPDNVAVKFIFASDTIINLQDDEPLRTVLRPD